MRTHYEAMDFDFESDNVQWIEERRLVGTMITGRPNPQGVQVALGTVVLMALTTLFYWGNFFGSAQLFPAVSHYVFVDWQWWRLLTAVFIHGDFGHYLSNMYMLSIFSYFVFGYFGFEVFPLLSLFFAVIVNGFAVFTYEPYVHLLGASGLVYLLGGFWLGMYFLIQRQYSVGSRILRVGGMGILIFFPTSFVENTSYRTHAIGFILGIVMSGIYFFRNKKKIRSKEVYKTTSVEAEPQFH